MAGVHAIMGSKKSSALAVYFAATNFIYLFAYTPTDVTTTFFITNAGTVTGSNLTPYNWLLSGLNSDYAVKAQYAASPGVPGVVSVGSIGVWEVLSTTRGWEITRTSNAAGISEVILDMQVRRVSDSVVIATFQVTIQAEVV